MKVDFIKKAKWFIIGFILVAIMLSVSLSFCSWDKMSINLALSKGNSGWFSDKDKMYLLEVDSNNNHIVDVGDIVSFGKYYQEANTTTKTPIRWIVVENINSQLTLLAEKVMAFGCFWGNWYNDGTNNIYGQDWGEGWNWYTTINGGHYPNYSLSTLRAWLNSNYSLRSDAGTTFSSGNKEPRFRGFYSEAFTSSEQSYIVSKTMSGMKGYGKDNNPSTRTENYASITDKVWVPSWSEVYGTTNTQKSGWNEPLDKNWNVYDGSPSSQFSYFKGSSYTQGNVKLNGYTTAFASSKYSNYTVEGAISSPNMQNSISGSNVWWWLRSPSPSYWSNVLMVNSGGSGNLAGTKYSTGGVRPAIIIAA